MWLEEGSALGIPLRLQVPSCQPQVSPGSVGWAVGRAPGRISPLFPSERKRAGKPAVGRRNEGDGPSGEEEGDWAGTELWHHAGAGHARLENPDAEKPTCGHGSAAQPLARSQIRRDLL